LHLYEPTSKQIADIVLNNAWFVPVILIVPTIGFIFLQDKIGKGSSGSGE
jgi:hypothetical protein